MGFIFDLFKFLTPDDTATESQLKNWRNRVAFSGISAWFAIIVLSMVVSINYRANAEDKEAQQKITSSLSSLSDSVRQLVDNDKARRINDVRERIYTTQERACKAISGSELRDNLNAQLRDLRNQYRSLAGEEFPVFTCADLLGK